MSYLTAIIHSNPIILLLHTLQEIYEMINYRRRYFQIHPLGMGQRYESWMRPNEKVFVPTQQGAVDANYCVDENGAKVIIAFYA